MSSAMPLRVHTASVASVAASVDFNGLSVLSIKVSKPEKIIKKKKIKI